jgi:CRISPR/Cas system-associated exonuclease Cas4 (RecB family)
MQGFLFEIAKEVVNRHKNLDDVTLVFPNRRAILYFRKHLQSLLTKPAFSPELVTIEEFVSQFSTLQVPDKLELVKILYKVYYDRMKFAATADIQSFSDFFFWGEMLLRDFEEIDKYLVNDAQLFLDLSNQKELDAVFEFLSEEQVIFLQEFWGDFGSHPSANKERFLKIWKELRPIYHEFKNQLLAERKAYEGMLHRQVAEDLSTIIAESKSYRFGKSHLIFAGFNALTLAEEKIISFFVENGNADVYWDTDAYYLNNNVQEAGTFFREYRQHSILGKTFPPQSPAFIQEKITNKTPVQLVEAPHSIGQVKALSTLLEQHKETFQAEETLIVLPDEKLLLPVLHGLPSGIGKINVTMGLSMAATPLFDFVDHLIELHLSYANDHFHHKPAIALLQHPYTTLLYGDKTTKARKHIISQNWVDVPVSYFEEEAQPLNELFCKVDVLKFIEYIQESVTQIGKSKQAEGIDKEYAFGFYKFLNRLQQTLREVEPIDKSSDESLNTTKRLRSLRKLLQQLARNEKIPFAGEPLEGLQIMGVLETRNLDFKNVFMLSLNEGVLPSGSSKGSYIPYNIRKAYGLPTVTQQDAMYAYLFYRSWQRAENVFLFYNGESDSLGQGEVSRFVQQLIYESGLTIERAKVYSELKPAEVNPIVIEKTGPILQRLSKLSDGNGRSKGIAPSALNTYLECRLKFYLRYVAGIKEVKEVEEDMDNRVLGNILHLVMEKFYSKILKHQISTTIQAEDIEKHLSLIDTVLDEVFRETYGLDQTKAVDYKGQRFVVKEIVKRLVLRIIQIDRAYAPFQLEALEREGLVSTIDIERAPGSVILGGIIDRIDRKQHIIRVVDYKTGKDELSFKDIDSLFERSSKRNKAAFQTFIYALLYAEQIDNNKEVKLKPGLINRKNLFSNDFTFGLRMNGEVVENALPLLPEFTAKLKTMLNELFDPEVTFDQTTDLDSCRYCEFNSICYRK